jgi:hypothetical protein
VTLGILCGSLVGVVVTTFIVLASEGGGSNDGTGWAWLDVVRIGRYLPRAVIPLLDTDLH